MKRWAIIRLFKRMAVLFLAHSVCFMPVVTVDYWWQEVCFVGLLLSWLWYDAGELEMRSENRRKTDERIRRHHKVATAVMDLACDYGECENLIHNFKICTQINELVAIISDAVFHEHAVDCHEIHTLE